METARTADEANKADGLTRVHFRFGKRWISAAGTHCDAYRNVVLLRIQPSPFDRLVSWLLQLMPLAFYPTLRYRLPEWFLPPRIVLKRQKVGWDEEFENEKHIYETLAPLQGKVIPICYGEAQCPATETTGTRALVLSDVGGVCLSEDAAKGFDVEQLEAMLSEPFRALAELKVSHDDYKLDNYRLVGDKIIIIDFDSSYIFETEDPDFVTFRSVKFVSRLYNNVHRGGARMKW